LEGSGGGASLSAGALLGNLGEIWRDMDRRAQADITLHWDPAGEFGRRLIYQGLGKALEAGTFLHGGLFTGNSERLLKGGSGNWASLSMGAL